MPLIFHQIKPKLKESSEILPDWKLANCSQVSLNGKYHKENIATKIIIDNIQEIKNWFLFSIDLLNKYNAVFNNRGRISMYMYCILNKTAKSNRKWDTINGTYFLFDRERVKTNIETTTISEEKISAKQRCPYWWMGLSINVETIKQLPTISVSLFFKKISKSEKLKNIAINRAVDRLVPNTLKKGNT